MRPPGVVEANPVADDSAGVLQGLEPMSMHALLLERSDQPFHHAVLLRAVRRDELLAQSVAAYEGCVIATGKDQPVIRSQQEGLGDSSQSAEARDQRLL